MDFITADAVKAVLTDPVTMDPSAWDENFLTAILPLDAITGTYYETFGVEFTDHLGYFIQIVKTFANNAKSMLADAGIETIEDLTTETIKGKDEFN